MSSETLIDVTHLSRRYGPIQAVSDISFKVSRGEVLGFLGPNGAGKSTTMQMLTGNLAPSHGSIKICGIDLLDKPKEAKAQIGYLPEQPPVYRELTVDEYLTFCARINRIPKHQIANARTRAKERCGLNDVSRRLIGNLSKGYQQRVGIAQAIIHSPAIVVLDEPTVGLDPIQIREIRSLIRELSQEHGVILSTHILPEVQMTCDRVQIISRGHLVYNDSMANLNQQTAASSVVVSLSDPVSDNDLMALPDIQRVDQLGPQRWRLHFQPDTQPTPAIAKAIIDQGWQLLELTPEHKTLEQIFVDITTAEEIAAHHKETESAEAAA
ncbi:MAG: ATP-binding cassette domain-containing protein [Gammaproteobacteria bacterium]|nr:ATP-binding cassette domain-containing protein [Gammaproteobacteria bacterium]